MADELCPNCGTPYEPDGTFCINCGAKRQKEKKGNGAEAPARASGPSERAGKKAAGKKPPEGETPAKGGRLAEEDALERLDKELTGDAAAKAGAEAEPPGPAKAAPPPVDEELAGIPPAEPKKKSRKGCCIVLVVAGLLAVLAVACGFVLYFTGALDELGLGGRGGAFTQDFAAATEEDFTVWQIGRGAEVKPEKGTLKVKDALVGVNYDPGTNYAATCAIFVSAVENENGWAGLALRVNPKGGDRYSFEIIPAKKTTQIRKIAAKGKSLTLAESRVPALAVGAPFTVGAAVSGSDLTMEVNGTVVGRATDIGLLQGPMGLEARGATAYFDDLSIEPK